MKERFQREARSTKHEAQYTARRAGGGQRDGYMAGDADEWCSLLTLTLTSNMLVLTALGSAATSSS